MRGQARRFEKVAQCGGDTGLVWSSDAGHSFAQKVRCDCWRVCRRCLRARQARLRTGVTGQRRIALAVHRHRLARRYAGIEGRWTEKLITFTVPHGESPAADAALLPRLWAEWARSMGRHLKKRGLRRGVSPVWLRALEVAPNRGGGHAHLHVWYVGPYLEHAWLHIWWGRALEAVGRRVPYRSYEDILKTARDRRSPQWFRRFRKLGAPWPVVDIRRATDEAAVEYASKVGVVTYVTKGLKRQPLEPAHAAKIYESTEGVRCVQWCRGWAPKREKSPHKWRLLRIRDEGRESQSGASHEGKRGEFEYGDDEENICGEFVEKRTDATGRGSGSEGIRA